MMGGLAMKRKEFIREIEENLSGKMTAMEIRDVVYDYNEYFDVGIREGKLEEDLCGQWGSPAKNGSPLASTNIFAREVLGKLILNSLSFGIASLISFVWALVSKEHKTVHDVIGGTRVVNVPEAYQKGK